MQRLVRFLIMNTETEKPNHQKYLDEKGYTIDPHGIYKKKDSPFQYSLALVGSDYHPTGSAIMVNNMAGGRFLMGSLDIMQKMVDSGELILSNSVLD